MDTVSTVLKEDQNPIRKNMILTLKELYLMGFLIEGFYLNANAQEAMIFFFALGIFIIIYTYIVKLRK